jgi:hypothetical protein
MQRMLENEKATVGRTVDTAAALAGAQITWWHESKQRENEKSGLLYKYCEEHLPVGKGMRFGRDEWAHYYYAQALYFAARKSSDYPGMIVTAKRWNDYRDGLFERLQARQAMDGSWPAGDGLSVGSVYSTAVWCTILQLDMNRHPLTPNRRAYR